VRCLVLGVLLVAGPASAQSDPEVIQDDAASAPVSAAPPPPLSPAVVGGRIHQRTLVDTVFEDDLGEDIVEARSRFGLHVEAPMSERVRTRISARLDHRLLVPGEGDGTRASAEPRLLDAYVDVDLGALDLRAGQQVISWGRVDAFPTADFLNPPDLTEGLSTDLEAAVVPVPALRADLGASEWLSLAVVYEPFFVPARVELFGSDFALVGPGASAEERAQIATLRGLVDDSVIEDVQDDLLATELPDETVVNGQVGGRIEARGPEGAVALSGFSGYEKIPTATIDPALRDYLSDPTDIGAQIEMFSRVQAGERVFRSRYRRMQIVALDGEMPAGDLLLRFDLGWTRERTLYYAATEAGCALPCPVRSGVVQVAFQAEYTSGETWLVTAELVVLHATRPPPAGTLLMFGEDGTLPATVVAVRRTFLAGDLELSVFGFSTWKPRSLIASGTGTYRLAEGLRVEAGAIVYEGEGSQSPGAVYDPNDAAFAGVRWDF